VIYISYGDYLNSSKLNLIKNKIFAYAISFKSLGWLTGTTFFFLGSWYSVEYFPFYQSILAIFGGAFIAFSSSLINNVFDKKLDIFSKKQYVIIHKYIESKEMLIISSILTIIGLIFLWLININCFIIGFITVFFGLIYSIPPIRLKSKPPLDCIINTLILGPLPFFLGWSITEKPITITAYIFGFIIYLFIQNYVLLYTNLDIYTDKEFGIGTTCTKLGFNGSIIAAIITFFISLIFSIIYFGLYSIFTISVIAISPFFLAAIIKINNIKFRTNATNLSIFFWMTFIYLVLTFLTKSIITFLMIIIILLWIFTNRQFISRVVDRLR
jgi:4-hydroxybenzoate polyprenyltransferase